MERELSAEQKDALASVMRGHNVMINSVAGGGKTTFVLHAIRAVCAMRKSVLFLTYNRRLRDETLARASDIPGAKQMIYTYHAYCGRITKPRCICKNDVEIERALNRATFESRAKDIIFIDEAQDLTPILFRVIARIYWVSRGATFPQIVILGDQFQCIYEYQEADARYLTMARNIFETDREWCAHEFTRTWRCSPNIVACINAIFADVSRECNTRAIPRIECAAHSCATIPSVEYICHYKCEDKVAQRAFMDTIANVVREYGARNTMILMPSVSKGSRIYCELFSFLSEIHHIRIMQTKTDNSTLGLRPSDANKLLVCTYHQAKGIERDCVIVFSADSSYYIYNDSEMHPLDINNAQYVAMTRAKRKLIFVLRSIYRNSPNYVIPAILYARQVLGSAFEIKTFANSHGIPNISHREFARHTIECRAKSEPSTHMQYLPVTQIVNHLTTRQIVDIMTVIKRADPEFAEHYTQSYLQDTCDPIELPMLDDEEDISDINGIAITLLMDVCRRGCTHREWLTKNIPILDTNVIPREFRNSRKIADRFLREISAKLHEPGDNLLPIFARFAALQSFLTHMINFYRINQISRWNWLCDNTENIETVVARLLMTIRSFESNFHDPSLDCAEFMRSYQHTQNIVLSCATDYEIVMRDENAQKTRIVFEIKCTRDGLEDAHIIQLALYNYIIASSLREPEQLKFVLYNPLTNELRVLGDIDRATLREIADIATSGSSANRYTDDDFCARARSAMDREKK
jgi:hypothetical protein